MTERGLNNPPLFEGHLMPLHSHVLLLLFTAARNEFDKGIELD